VLRIGRWAARPCLMVVGDNALAVLEVPGCRQQPPHDVHRLRTYGGRPFFLLQKSARDVPHGRVVIAQPVQGRRGQDGECWGVLRRRVMEHWNVSVIVSDTAGQRVATAILALVPSRERWVGALLGLERDRSVMGGLDLRDGSFAAAAWRRLCCSATTRNRPAIKLKCSHRGLAGGPLQEMAEALLSAWQTINGQISVFSRRLIVVARGNQAVKRLLTAPGVGILVALPYASVIDDPQRFAKSSSVSA
jgi:hypothetical protein